MAVTRTRGGALPTVTTGRDLAMFTIAAPNVAVSSSAVNSIFEKLVFGIETISTVEILGTPSGTGANDAFRVAISGANGLTAANLLTICNTAIGSANVSSVTAYTF